MYVQLQVLLLHCSTALELPLLTVRCNIHISGMEVRFCTAYFDAISPTSLLYIIDFSASAILHLVKLLTTKVKLCLINHQTMYSYG
jgi:hypothetical protein